MNTIVKMNFGSHLYGTNTPESDTDYKGIFLPTKKEILLGKIPKSINTKTKRDKSAKNSSNDIDTEFYSLQYFIHLACEGETVALDMLHAPDNMILEKTYIWDNIAKYRHKFYTKNLKSFIGYARRQASKYGIKGSRLNDAKKVLDFLENTMKVLVGKLSMRWDYLPEGEHIFKHPPNENNVRMYEVCGRKIGETATFEYAYEIVERFYNAYGERAIQAANNENIDWKAVSHALRAAYQVKQILMEGTITFPLKQAEVLKNIKAGHYNYRFVIAPMLDDLMGEVEELSLRSALPEKVDRDFWDDFIQTVIEKEYWGRDNCGITT